MNPFRDGWHNLLAAPLRSLLALAGILVGTGSVVAMLAGGELATQAALEQFRSLGTNLLDVSVMAAPGKSQETARPPLNVKDVETLVDTLPAITLAAPYTLSYPSLSYLGHPLQGTTSGVTQDFATLMKTSQHSGRFLSAFDHHAFFCVIGADLARQMKKISPLPPEGQRLRAGHFLFTVIGVLEPWPESIFLPMHLDHTLLIPLEAALLIDNTASLNHLMFQIAPEASLSETEHRLIQQLQTRLPDKKIFVRSPRELIAHLRQQSDILTLYLGMTGGITLLVGGIGVMNIMLVSVLERRREIGIRLALGATPKNIRQLFLAEATLLALLGGMPGILLGLLVARGLAWFSGWSWTFFWLPPLAGFTVSTLTGILAGWYPAARAASLDPVVALRSE